MRDLSPAGGLLPLPSGDPGGLWRAAGWLRAAAGQVESTPLAATRVLPAGAVDGWSGPAAQDAATEVAVVGSRASALADRLGRAASVLGEYGDALDAAQRVTVGLQAVYDDSRLTGPPAPDALSVADPTGLAVLAGRYAVAMADLDLAGAVAAHRLRALAAEVGDGPVGRGGQRSGSTGTGWAAAVDPDPRGAALAGLPLVAAARHRLEAEGTADEVIDALASVSAGDPWAVSTAASLLDASADDPVFAQALWSRLSPDELAVVLAAVAAPSSPGGRALGVSAAWRADRGAALVRGLGSALAIAANPAYAVGLDPTTDATIGAWRRPWLDHLAEEAGEVVRRPDGTTIGGAWVQGQLLAAATAAGLAPGASYASTVGVAIVAADIRAGSSAGPATSNITAPSTALIAPDGRSATAPGLDADPVRALSEALLTDAAAARAWLVHPLPGTPGRLVVDHLVDQRYLDLDPSAGAAALADVTRLVVAVGSDPTSRDATLVTAAFLDAVGRTALDSPQPAVFRRVLSPALGDLGSLVGAHADGLTATLDDSAAPGTDAATLTPAERLVRPGRAPGTWEVVLVDRSRAAALVGALALDWSTSTTARDPASSPALTLAMSGIGATLEADLAAAVAARRAGSDGTQGIEAAARRLGSTTGFVLTSAGTALALRDADSDTDHQRLAGLAELAVGKITLPGPAGRLATPLVRAAADRLVDLALPAGAAAAQRSATSLAVAQRRDDTLVAVRTLVSRAQPWTPEQSPQRWASHTGAATSPVPFWTTAGVPLSEADMTTAQRRAFTDWRRDEGLDVYETVPQVVRDAIDQGVRDAVATRTPPPAQ